MKRILFFLFLASMAAIASAQVMRVKGGHPVLTLPDSVYAKTQTSSALTVLRAEGRLAMFTPMGKMHGRSFIDKSATQSPYTYYYIIR